ncbi:MAG: ribosome small subunit-dependent GTPase A [Clostridiales Family XIII bacterium]|nr:ribosome small subunit-dependent GTPase A [Clostridiales Family XIII bacterium]
MTDSQSVGGQIVKALAGYYYVDTGEAVYQCRARGIFKKDGVTPLAGDRVRIVVQDAEEGVVDEILPRKNAFIRPPVANIDLFAVTVAAAAPETSLELTDRFLAMAEAAEADACVCINKDDLSPAAAKRIEGVYQDIYPAVVLSAATGEGVGELRALVAGRSVAFAGASGVGKTSLIALLADEGALKTGDVSARTGRGRHTTRHVEIFTLADGTKIYDTPGFTSFEATVAADLSDFSAAELFPEFRGYLGACRYRDCLHENEPDCAVREALASGAVKRSRYASYLKLLAEMKDAENNY